jgi:copper(I)-binding protein
VALAATLPACRPGPPSAAASLGQLRLRHGFAYEPITLASGAAYVEITNQGAEADTLVDATSPLAAMAMFHGGSMASMNSVVIAPGATVTFAPGGAHIMLTSFSAMPMAGDSLQLTLTFARAGSVTLELPVRKYGGD